MNTIIISRQGILDTPILIENDITAQTQFEEIATELLGDDISEVCLTSDSALDQVNNLIKYSGIEVFWFVDVEVNSYVNEVE